MAVVLVCLRAFQVQCSASTHRAIRRQLYIGEILYERRLWRGKPRVLDGDQRYFSNTVMFGLLALDNSFFIKNVFAHAPKSLAGKLLPFLDLAISTFEGTPSTRTWTKKTTPRVENTPHVWREKSSLYLTAWHTASPTVKALFFGNSSRHNSLLASPTYEYVIVRCQGLDSGTLYHILTSASTGSPFSYLRYIEHFRGLA